MALANILLIALSLIISVQSQSDITLDFVAAAPNSYDPEVGGGAFNNRVVDYDVATNLDENDFSCGDRVTFLTSISVSTTASLNQNLYVCYDFNADSSIQSGLAFTKVLTTKINYGRVRHGGGKNHTDKFGYDLGIVDDGDSTVLNTYSWIDGTPYTAGALLKTCVMVDDLEPGEKVVLRQDVLVECKASSTPTGIISASIISASRAVPGTTTNVTVPAPTGKINLDTPKAGVGAPLPRSAIALLSLRQVCNENTDFSQTSANAFVGDELKYCIKVRNSGTQAWFDASVSYDSGTPLNINDDVIATLGEGFTNIGGSATALDMAPSGVAYITLQVPPVVFATTSSFAAIASGSNANNVVVRSVDSVTITFSTLPHLVFVRHEVSENLLSLIPELPSLSRGETFILPYWRTSWTGGSTNTLLTGSTPAKINGANEKMFSITTTERTFSFTVRKYSKEKEEDPKSNTTRKTNFFLIDYAHPFESPADQAVYDKAWSLSIVRLADLEAELIRAQVNFSEEEITLIRRLISIFHLLFDAVTAQLLDVVIDETTLVDHLGKTSAISLFANTLYGSLSAGRKWQLILTLDDYVYLREALSPATLSLFSITGNFEQFTSSSGYLIIEAYAVRFSYFVTVPADYIRKLLQRESSVHMPFPFFGILRRELYLAEDQQRLRVNFPGVDASRWSLLARNYPTQPLSDISAWKSTSRATFSERFPSKYCSGNPAHWAVWQTTQFDHFDGTSNFEEYAKAFSDAGVCLVFSSSIPYDEEFQRLLEGMDAEHKIIWLSEYDSEMSRLAMLGADFGFLPNVEVGWPLGAIQHLMHGNRLISPAEGGIRDVAIFRNPGALPSISAFQAASAAFPSTASVGQWLGTSDLCSAIFPSLLPQTYSFSLSRGVNFYSEPITATLTSALTLAINDKLQYIQAQTSSTYLLSLVLQGHCYSWTSSSLPSLGEYRSVLAQLSAVTGAAPSSSLTVGSYLPIPFTVNQKAQFLKGSHHTIQCPERSLSDLASANSLQFNHLRSEYVKTGVIDVLAIFGISPALLSRYLVSNIVDKDHFPDVQCVFQETAGSFSDTTLMLDVPQSYVPLPSAVNLLSLNQKLAVSTQVTAALASLEANHMCHGALTGAGILVELVSDSVVHVKLINLSTPAVGDLAEVECRAADVTAWNSVKTQYSL